MSELLKRIADTAINQGCKPALETPDKIISYEDLNLCIDLFYHRLLDSNCCHMAILLDNEPEWIICQLAAFKADIPVTPIPAFFSDAQIHHLLQSSGVDLVICHDSDRLTALNLGLEPAPGIHRLALYARSKPVPLPSGTALVTFTSGTSAQPKGVCLDIELIDTLCASLLGVVSDADIHRHASLLPLPILLENVAGTFMALYAGQCSLLAPLSAIGLTGSGLADPQRLAAFLQRHQPDSLILVPELLKLLIGLVAAGAYRHRLKFVAVGGARLSPLLLEQAEALSIPVYQGYGLSEFGSVVALNRPGQNRSGSVGTPLGHCDIEVADDGEIFVRGPRMLGYLNVSPTEEPTEETMEEPIKDPMIATGDLGRLDSDGYLYIQGRKKNLLINSFGRNLSPEWIESELSASPLIHQACLYGDARPFNVALVTPALQAKLTDVQRWIEEFNQQVPDYARIQCCIPTQEPFSIANGQLTANGRVKRDAIYGDYSDDLNRCYC